MLEYWTHCKNQCFGPTLHWRTRKLCCFWRKDWNNTVRTCVLDRLYAQKWSNMYKLRGCWRKTIKKHCKKKLKHVQYLYKDRTKKLAVWAAPHAKRGEYRCRYLTKTTKRGFPWCFWKGEGNHETNQPDEVHILETTWNYRETMQLKPPTFSRLSGSPSGNIIGGRSHFTLLSWVETCWNNVSRIGSETWLNTDELCVEMLVAFCGFICQISGFLCR